VGDIGGFGDFIGTGRVMLQQGKIDLSFIFGKSQGLKMTDDGVDIH
jgi:hypothetical protein